MPKLDATHIAERLRKRLAELEAGADVAAKDVRALLTPDKICSSRNRISALKAQARL
jgi:hypothetical protein